MTATSPVEASVHRDTSVDLPSGRVGIMFTDIEGSTIILEKLGQDYGSLISRHSEILRNAIADHKGKIAGTSGDSFFAVFSNPTDAVPCAIQTQSALANEQWTDGTEVKVRIGVHCGEATLFEGEYVGLDIHRAARISDAGNGGQILASRAMIDLLDDTGMLKDLRVRALGLHRLKGLHYRESLYEILVPGVPQNFAPVRSLERRPSNLPTAAVHLIGRDEDVKALNDLVVHGETQLVTLVGAGGIGKTSLAIAVGREATDGFLGGTFLVELSSVSEPDLVASTIASTLGVRDFPGRSVLQDIAANIGEAKTLLILDTFEHVIDAAPDVSELLASCENLRILVTSREALNIQQERIYEIAPLERPTDAITDPHELQNIQSVRLFVERVHAFDSKFDLDEENAAAVSQICRQLEGLPLAIELAAARMRLMPAQAIAERLGDRLALLTGGKRDHDARHQTLRKTIEWSDNLLSETERKVFQRASVFAGGFRLEDAEAVIAFENEDVVNHLFALTTKSLLFRADLHGTPRLTMFDSVRDYAQSSLANNIGFKAVNDRHADHFASIAEAAAPHLVTDNQRPHVTRLLDEADNLRAALSWSFQQETTESIARLLGAMHWLWIAQAQFTEARKWIEQGLKVAEHLETSTELARILDIAGWVRLLSGDYEGALPVCAGARRTYEALNDKRGVAYTGLTLGVAYAVAMNPEGPTLIRESLEAFHELDDPIGTALSLIALGEGARAGGDDAAAEDCDLQALEILTKQGNTYWPCQILQNLAHIRLHEGDWKKAADHISEALTMGHEYGYAMIETLCVAAWGGVELKRGRTRRAAQFFGAADTMSKILGVKFEPVDHAEYESNMERAKKSLGETAFDIAFKEGERWNREETLSNIK